MVATDHLYTIEKLGVASYFLAVAFFLLSVSASFKFAHVFKFIDGWSSQKIFHLVVCIHLYVRTIAFGLLGILWIVGSDMWYPGLVFLFTLPEFLMLTTYTLLCFHWLETYVFSHEQFVIPSIKGFRQRWLIAFFVISVLLYAGLAVLYVLLAIRSDALLDDLTSSVEMTFGIGSLALPGLLFFLVLYFSCFLLSGFPYASMIARERTKKMTWVLLIWTVGRVTRGVISVVAIHNDWQTNLTNTLNDVITVTVMAVCELLPFMVALDWSVIGISLLGEETQRLKNASSQYGGMEDSADGVSVNANAMQSMAQQQKWEIDVNQIRFNPDIVHDAGFCFTQKGTWNGRPVSIKGFRFQGVEQQIIDELVSNLVDYNAVHHEQLVQFFGIARSGTTVYQITELMERGSLASVLEINRGPLPGPTIVRVAYQTACAMLALHQMDQVHGHLKSSNVLLDSDMNARVGDYGVRPLKAYVEVMLVKRMTTAFSAPEVLSQQRAGGKESDVYSFAMVCYHMLTGSAPFEGVPPEQIIRQVVRLKQRPALPERLPRDLPAGFVRLLEQCWAAEPSLRPHFEQITTQLREMLFGAAGGALSPLMQPSSSSSSSSALPPALAITIGEPATSSSAASSRTAGQGTLETSRLVM